jgi:hypothetical protein
MTRITLAALLAISWAGPAGAHQLDEYLQATRLDLSRDRLVVDVSLTAGASIASGIIALIDRDGDGTASAAEMEAYARRVLEDLRLTIDGRACPLALVRVVSPSWDDLREGLGTIRLEAAAEHGLGRGPHRVTFENAHQPAPSVYSVNVLKPDSGDVSIGAQRRDVLQHRIEIDVDVSGASSRVAWAAAASALIGALLILRRRSPRYQTRGRSRQPACCGNRAKTSDGPMPYSARTPRETLPRGIALRGERPQTT